MKKVRKLISIALIFVMTASTLLFIPSCRDGEEEVETTTAASTTIDTPITEAPIPSLEIVDLGEYVFNVLWPSTHADEHFLHNEISVEEDSGDLIESAVYTRNLNVEMQYNIDIVSTIQSFTDIIKTMEKLHGSGDFEFDAFCSQLVNVSPLATKGVLADYKDMKYYNEEQPWWNHKAMQGFALVDHRFFGTGDIIVSDDYYANCIMANLKLVTDYGLDNPYDVVRDGTWTIDKMLQMSTGIAENLDGSDEWTYNDQYGLIVTNSNSKGMFYGFGKNLVVNDSDGNIQWVMTPEYTQDALEKICEVFSSPDTLNTQPTQNRAPGLSHAQTAEKIFGEGRALFKVAALLSTELQRSSSVVFAVLPMPKYTVEQEEYVCLLNDATLLCVPSNSVDLDRTSLILSAMGRASMDTLTPAFYEQALTAKYIKDNDSVDMIGIVLDAVKVPDVATTFNYGNFLSDFYALVEKNSTNFSSVYQRDIKKAQAEIDALLKQFH